MSLERLAEAWKKHVTDPNAHLDLDATPTATKEEQLRIKAAFANGATIEAKGRDTLFNGYEWAVTETPRFDFRYNYYRIKDEQPALK